ncbi:hypothetical protein BKA64DRAFT_51220 [Cadophora sp. MPI-SDFR-AT-0126]|nr:hypothetical protein BKA64DRAFT_51220 [Leotiomycetes sp. MPI-SDFR-AT-0126]
MEPYSSSYISEDQDEEPYHCSPAYEAQDIICLGSDSEDTSEEIALKHKRYEAEAQRCIEGKLPMIQSASLKGPFDVGWINPWRYRPKKKLNEDWWQPGSEDMLFTRAKVMQRAAAHGLGYLEPADALKWCKATAQAEAEAIHETSIQSGQIMRSVERDDLQDSEDTSDIPAVDDSHQAQTKYRPSHSPNDPELSMLNHHSKTPRMSQGLDSSINIMKRPADSQWLKGSYVSKRARWEGPAVPFPTPLPDLLERDRRKRQLSARSIDRAIFRTQKSSHLSKSFPNNNFTKVPKPRLAQVRNAVPTQELLDQPDYGVIATSDGDGRTSHLGYEDFRHQPDDFDELQDSSQHEYFRPAPQSSVKSKKVQTPIDDRSFSDLESDDLIVITPRTKPSRGVSVDKSLNSDIRMSNTGLDDSYDLPELPRTYQNHISGAISDDGDSFITEVAPSSRNVEKFQFKKRRAKFPMHAKSEEDQGIGEGRQSRTSNAQSQQSAGRSTRPGIIQTIAGMPAHFAQEQVSSTRAPSVEEKPARESQATPPQSDRSSSSWDLAKDIIQSSSFTRATNAPQTTSPPKSTNSTSASPLTTPRKIAEPSLISSISGHLLRSFKKTGKPSAAPMEPPFPVCSNKMSTQSFNTTPPGSLINPIRKSLALLREPFSQHFKAAASPQKQIPTEMDKIQLALSQICPSSSRTDNSHNSPDEPLEPITIEDILLSKAQGSQLQGSSSNSQAHAVRRQSQNELAPGLPDMEFTSFTNESFLFLGDYLAETAPAVTSAVLEDGHQIEPPSPVIFQHRPPVSTDEAQEEHGLLEHPQMDQEGGQISIDTSCMAAIVLEQGPRALSHGRYEEFGADPQDTNHIQRNRESADVTNIAAARSSSVAEDRSQPSSDETAHSIHNGAIFDRDVTSLNNAQIHHESKNANNDDKSVYVAAAGPQVRLSLDADIQDDQIERNWEDVREEDRQIRDDDDQVRKESDPGSVVVHDEAAAFRLDFQRGEPANGSETSWEGCGPQSPWAAEKIELLPTVISMRQAEDISPRYTGHDGSRNTESTGQDNELVSDETSWVTIPRPSTPDYGEIKPFKDFSTPTTSPERQLTGPGSSSMETLSLADATMQNPWTTNSKNRCSAKPRKRVSFGIVPLDEVTLQEKPYPSNSTPRSPPPAQVEPIDQDEDMFNDGTTVTTTFNKHFVAAARPRQFKRILPQVRASQLDSSPSKLEAQAEAFIAADHDIPVDRATYARVTPSRHLKLRSDSNTNSIWNDGGDAGDDSLLSNPFSRSPLERVPGRQDSVASFDMASALGEAAGFLEDWSVDTVLKPVKEKETTNRAENNGMRRRKLFGLV